MTEPQPTSSRLVDLVDVYVSGQLDEGGLDELESLLVADSEALRYFVHYASFHTDLHLEMRARNAGRRALSALGHLGGADFTGSAPDAEVMQPRWWALPRIWLAVAGLLILAGAASWMQGWIGVPSVHDDAGPAIAWLVNAQNCQWADGAADTGDMQAGTILRLERGLAEIRFQCGATAVIEGPAELELLTARRARLRRGRLTAKVPQEASGFEVLSPQGKVIDLGTEFGIHVAESGVTDVVIFDGKVEAHVNGSHDRSNDRGVSLTRNQSARIAEGKITLQTAKSEELDQFVRAIVPPPVITPRTMRLTFQNSVDATLRDKSGAGIGLTHRLPGTGSRLETNDPNLLLDPRAAQLELTTTESDLNTKFRLARGEYLGVRLADLGFTGSEDFAVAVTIPDIPALELVGQVGVYAGPRSDQNIRGGVISRGLGEYTQFLVNNHDGNDADFNRVGLFPTGTDLRLTLKRSGGKYLLRLENLTLGNASTLTNRHPEFLDRQSDFFVGVFAANTQSKVRRTIVLKEFEATVWTVSSRSTR
jgi:hypothetical protein